MNARNRQNTRVRRRQALAHAVEPLEQRQLLSAGSLDPTFGVGGKVVTDINGQMNAAYSVALSNGKYLVAGSLQGDFVLARYNANGTLDTTFGAAHTGYVTADFGSDSDEAYAMAVQADGKVVLAGHTQTLGGFFDFAVARFNADGSLDTTFAPDHSGKVVVDFAGDFDQASSVAVQADGKIVATGTATIAFNANFALVRLNADGTLDAGFGAAHNGKIAIEWSGAYAESTSVAVQSDGRILAAGYASSYATGSADAAVVRFNTDGSLDATFGSGGFDLVDFTGADDIARAIAVGADGKILLAGYSSDHTGQYDFVVARLNPDGSVDDTLGGSGVILTDFAGTNDQAYALAVHADGKIVLVGSTEVNGQLDFAVARFNPDGSLDTTFGPAHTGQVTLDMGMDDTASGVLVGADDSILVVGTSRNIIFDYVDFALVKFAPPNTAPVADPGGPYQGDDVHPIALSGSASYDLDGSIVSYEWDFNYDGSSFDVDATGQDVSFVGVDGPATRTVALRVTDNNGATSIVMTTVEVQNVAPVANAGGPYVTNASTSLSLSGDGSSDADGSVVLYEWDFNYDGSSFDVNAQGSHVAWPSSMAPGVYTVGLRVTDNDGATHVSTATVTVNNQAPVASAGGPRVITEGDALTLSGQDSHDPDGSIVSYEWDLDYDGSSFNTDATGLSVSFPKLDGPAFRTVALRVTDNGGATSIVTTTVTVNNAKPVASVSGPDVVKKGSTATFNASFVDPAGDLDTYQVSWDFGDGTKTGFVPANGNLSVQHRYDRKGTYTVKFTVRDDDGGCGSATLSVDVRTGHVTMTPLSNGLMAMTVTGTDAGDEVRVRKPKKDNKLEVIFDGVSEGLFQADKVIIYGTGGNDFIRVDDSVTQPVEVFGGNGNDVIVGGKNDATLHGEGGCDHLFGGAGHNLLDGGDGNDFLHVGERNHNSATLLGGAGDDVLIGGGGNDLLDGGAGHDHLNGRGGGDTLLGGTGKDEHAKLDKNDVWSDPDDRVPAPKKDDKKK
ncbi:MAG TPA: PKD domain-containing protein [Tepidisphaeraceae bacterium]